MDDKFNEKLEQAVSICSGKYVGSEFDLLYPFTTENIAGYLPLFKLKGKSLLTVGSSCDQALNAILCGCKDITIIDCCPFVKEYYYLKKAVIENFSLEEFLNFFCYRNYFGYFHNNKNAFSLDMYIYLRDKIKDDDYESYLFWDKLFSKFSGLEIRDRLFNSDEYSVFDVCDINKYLISDKMFNRLRDKIGKVDLKFQIGNIFDLNVYGEYDNIFLSNLSACYSLREISKLFSKLLPILSDNGRILISYLYWNYGFYKIDLYNLLEEFRMVEKSINFDSFIGTKGISFDDEGMMDGVLTYKKVKKKLNLC